MTTKSDQLTENKLVQKVLADALTGNRAHVSPERAFEGITWRDAGLTVQNYPHTIWQLLKHMNYWQDRLISRIEGMKVLPAKSSDDGWDFDLSAENEEAYRRELGKFLTSIDYITQTMLPRADELKGSKGDYPNGYSVIQTMASHLSYHIGEVVLVRRMLGLWPPPSGGYSW